MSNSLHTEKSAGYKNLPGAPVKFQQISYISRSCRHPENEHVIKKARHNKQVKFINFRGGEFGVQAL